MKLTFSSQEDKDNALGVARSATPDACGQMYIYMLEEGIIDEALVEPKVADEIRVDNSIEQIKE